MFELVTGMVLVASWLNAPLFAMECFGAQTYFRRFWSSDSVLYKYSVVLALSVDFATVISVCAAAYSYSITNWGDANYAITQPWFISTYIVLCGISAMICQGLLSLRIWRLTQNVWYLPLLFAPSVLSLGGACATAGMAATLDLSGRESLTKVVVLWLAAKAAADIFIAACQILNLRRIKAEFQDSQNLVRRLSFQALETGSVTAFLAILAIALYAIFPMTNLAVCIGMTLGRVYSITLLTNLNRRNYEGKGEDDTDMGKSYAGRRVGFASEPARYGGMGSKMDGGMKSAARFDAADEEDDFDPIEPTVVYRTTTAGAFGSTKRSHELADDAWENRTSGSEVELGRAPLKHN